MEPADAKGRVDFGIITIREDEFEAILRRFPEEIGIASGRHQYNLRRLGPDDPYLVAVVRCAVQGNGEAQQVANALLDELAPRWLLVVGIGGGAPAVEHGLGDVVVSTQVADFRVGAALKDGSHEYALSGWVTHSEAQKHAANLVALRTQLGRWNSPESITVPRPEITTSTRNVCGDAKWKQKVRQALAAQVDRTEPRATAGAVGCSDLVIKDADLLQVWLKISRQVVAIEMESAGVHRAAHDRQVPTLSIRGLSDIVGLSRDPRWTAYACHSAAAFTRAFLLTRPIPPRPPEEAKGAPSAAAPGGDGNDVTLAAPPKVNETSSRPWHRSRRGWAGALVLACAAVGGALMGRAARWTSSRSTEAPVEALVNRPGVGSSDARFRCKGPALLLYTRPVFHGPKYDYRRTQDMLRDRLDLRSVELFEFLLESTTPAGSTQQYALVGVSPDGDTSEKLRTAVREINAEAGKYISCPAIQPLRRVVVE